MPILESAIKFLFSLFIFLLPWQTQLILREATLNGYVWEYGKVSFLGTELILWALLVLFGVWLVAPTRSQLISGAVVGRWRSAVIMGYGGAVGLVLVAGFSIIWAMMPTVALARWLTLVQAVAFFSFVMTYQPRLPAAALTLRGIALAWVSGAVIQSILGIYQFLLQYAFASTWLGLAWHAPWQSGSIILQTTTERWLRAYGSLPHPNVLAGYLSLGLLWCGYLAFYVRQRRQRFALSFSVAIISVALLFSFSRSAWIALLFGGLIFSVYVGRNPTMIRRVGLIFLPALVALIVLGGSLRGLVATRLAGVEPLEINSIQLRLTYVDQALALIKHSWLGGVGIGQYTFAVYEKINNNWPGYLYQPVHNLFLLVLAEVGLIGLLFFGGVLSALFYALAKAPKTPAVAVAIAATLNLMIIGLFDHYWWTHYTGVMMFWFVLAINFRIVASSGKADP